MSKGTSQSVDISLLGDAALQRKLARLDTAIQKKIVASAIRKAAKPVLAEAKRLAPVKTGKLRDNIHIGALRARKGSFGTVVQTGRREQMGIPADSKWYYPAIVEYGHGNVPPKSFMREAMNSQTPRCIAIIADEIKAGIRTATGGN